MKNNKTISYKDKTYQKSLQFGNRDYQIVYKNKKSYSRKEKFRSNYAE